MASSPLVACPSCARHVRVVESGCPFCGASFVAPLRARTPGRAPVAGLSRAALFALGAGTLALTPACSSNGGGAAQDAGSQMQDGPGVQPAYGGPPMPIVDSGFSADAPMGEPAYGGPPIRLDASVDAADAGVIDAADDAAPGDH